MTDTPNLDEALAQIVVKLDALAEDHGQTAVDLSLWAVQMSAITSLAYGFVFAVFAVACAVGAFRMARRARDLDPHDPSDIVCVFGAGVAGVGFFFLAFGAISKLLNISHWAAALGHPEVLIATNALKSAGLL